MKTLPIALVLLLLVSCDTGIPPYARLSTFPSAGDSTVLFELNASKSFDDRNYQVSLEYRWDFNGDRVWDTDFSNEPILVRFFPVPGIYPVSVEVMNPDGQSSITSDTVKVYGRNRDLATLTDPRDGQTYRIVKLNGRWWMAESLRYGTPVDPWSQGMTDNDIPERFVIQACYRPGSYSVYSWHEALDYYLFDNQGVCPDGWHIPAMKEWQSLYVKYPAQYIAIYLGKDGLSGLNLQDGVYVSIDHIDKILRCDTQLSSYWGSDYSIDTANVFRAGHVNFQDRFAIGFGFLDQSQLEANDRYQIVNSVRCIKDLD